MEATKKTLICDVYGTTRKVHRYRLQLTEDGPSVVCVDRTIDLSPKGYTRLMRRIQEGLRKAERGSPLPDVGAEVTGNVAEQG